MHRNDEVVDEADESIATELMPVLVICTMAVLVWVYVYFLYSVVAENGVKNDIRDEQAREVESAHQAFLSSNYVTTLDHAQISVAINSSSDHSLSPCESSGAVCLYSAIAYPQGSDLGHLREGHIAPIEQGFLIAPNTYGYAASCLAPGSKDQLYATFLMGGARVDGDLSEKLRQQVALIARQTGAVPVRHDTRTDVTQRFMALSGNNGASKSVSLFSFALRDGTLWLGGLDRKGVKEVLTVFEPKWPVVSNGDPVVNPICY